MLKWSFYTLFFFLQTSVFSQSKYWQQQVNYTINVSLDDEKHTLDGFETIEYINNSPDTLNFIWIHLWMNAYKDEKTAFCEQQLRNGDTKFYFSTEEQKGYINRLNFQANKTTLQVEDHPNYIDIVKIILDQPLAPNAKTIITTPFHVKLPYNFSRGGHVNQSYQITQWFPKAAMYDAKGWHEMPYLDQGEFYSNFGNYKVNITVPNNYVVAATGELQNEEEKEWLKTRTNFTPPTKEIKKNTNSTTKKVFTPLIISSKNVKTLSYNQDNVVDFAWFADKEFIVKSEFVTLPNNKKILCQNFYRKQNESVWNKGLDYMKDALLFRSKHIGSYPFNVATIVDAPMGFAGGMEYPTITSIAGSYNEKSLDMVIEHELGHNWFQGILASNERENPWLDEGLNTFYDNKYESEKYKKAKNKKQAPLFIRSISNVNNVPYILGAIKKDQPIQTSSVNFTSYNYNFIGYNKTAEWLEIVENKIGKVAMDSIMKAYFAQWQFKHPQPEDFHNMFQHIQLFKDSLQPLTLQKGNLKQVKKSKPSVFPLMVGFNKYNSLLVGALLHNYDVQERKLKYFLLPMYGSKTKDLNGLSKVVYNHFPKNSAFERIDIGLNAAKFGQNDFKDDRVDLKLGFTKLVPFIRFTLKEKTATSQFIKTIQFKHFNINEDGLQFKLIENPSDTFFQANKVKNNYYVNQLQFNFKRTSSLYPYNFQLQLEQTRDLIRTTITADQYFNYNAKNEGLSVRVFAGKISYLSTKTNTVRFRNDRYALNLLAPKGNEDYTYSTYFMGRNEFEGFSSNQILQRDGFFKFRTDLLANKPGRTDNWLASANFVTDIPSAINPLSALPIKIPLKIFADIGSNAEAWEKNSTASKFLYNAGLQLSILKNTIEIFWPLIYSKEFRDYTLQMYQKKRSIKNISFAINFNNFTLRKFVPQINF